MHVSLGINAGFAINRFPEPEVWIKIVGEELGLKYVQFVADLLNPFLPYRVMQDQINKIKQLSLKYDVKIDTTFTSMFTRVNHLMHPDPLMRDAWFQWSKDFVILSRELGARGAGSHFGIMSVTDLNDDNRKEIITNSAIESWKKLSFFASDSGLDFLMFEPMSIPREMACTIDETWDLYNRVNDGATIPILLCLDVDHGFALSGNPRDIDPYAWLEEFGKLSPVIHIKQSSADKASHWPFALDYNQRGIITPEKVLKALERSGADDVVLLLEVSHRERYPAEGRVLSDLSES
ncbi:D-erythrulose-1-phosphate dehydrogenase, partial [Patescibacteria group bacterium]|nr:D-erythrulose-1-phosphate dehydrogenase [Patescibacteria group bacterium]